MDWAKQNIHVYDQQAASLAAKFKGLGARVGDIENGLHLAQAGENARVVEIGCGDGRDAAEIIKRVAWYEGVDPSRGLLAIARDKVPAASFVQADALSYVYPKNIDVVFAFASLLHVNQDDIQSVFHKVADALRPGGIFYISLKYRPEYCAEMKDDEFGKRMFYYYNPKLITEYAGSQFATVQQDRQDIRGVAWFTIALKKL